MLGGRAFQKLNSDEEPEFLFWKHMTSSELRKSTCGIPEFFALTHFPAFAGGRKSMEVVFLDERMNGWRITYKSRIRRSDPNGSPLYALREGWQKVIEDKNLQIKDCVSFFRFGRSYIFLAIRRTAPHTLKVLESRSRELISLHPYQVRTAKLLASKFSLLERHFAVEYIACIYGMFGASSSTTSPTLSLQDFEAIYQLFRERAENGANPIELEESQLPYRIPRNFCGQDFDSTYRMIQERRNLRVILAGSANSPGDLSQSNSQSRRMQTQAYAEISPAYPQSSTNHSGHASQMHPRMFQLTERQVRFHEMDATRLFADAPCSPYPTYYIVYKQFPGSNFAGNVFQDPEVWRWIKDQIQESLPSFMASQIEQGTLTNTSGQDPIPDHGIAQERGAVNQAAVETSNGTQTHPQMFQSTGAQTQVDATSFPAYPTSYNQSFRSHFGCSCQTRHQLFPYHLTVSLPQFPLFSYLIVLIHYLNPTRILSAFVPRTNLWTGTQFHEKIPNDMAYQNQCQTPRSLSGQSSGTHTQIGPPIFTDAPCLMASQIQLGSLSSSSRQKSLPSYGMAQEAAETSHGCHPQHENPTRGTRIQAQQEGHVKVKNRTD